MALFRRGPSAPRRVLQASPSELAQVGETAFGGESAHPPGFSLTAYDQYAVGALEAAGYPPTGTPSYAAFESQFFAEAAEIGAQASPWGIVGAFGVATNLATTEAKADPVYVQVMFASLDILRRDGVAWTSVPPFAIDAWVRTYGRDGVHPKGWVSALRVVPVPPVGREPATDELTDDESRPLSRDQTDKRTMFAWRRSDGRVVGIIEGIDDADGSQKRWEFGIDADTYTDFLRQLGERLVTPQLWTHDDLMPYTPCRSRSRAEMREAIASGPPIGS